MKNMFGVVRIYIFKWLVLAVAMFSITAQAAFVTIGNPGNEADPASGGIYGDVAYTYKISDREVSAADLVGSGVGNGDEGTGSIPAVNISLYEAMKYCNYLTSGNMYDGAYVFSAGVYQHTDRAAAIVAHGTIYVLPTDDEWYKAAYFKPDASGYSLYANGTSDINNPPIDVNTANNTGWNYDGANTGNIGFWPVGSSALEQNGTYDMMGNVFEYVEDIAVRGGCAGVYAPGLVSTFRLGTNPAYGYYDNCGFRIVAIGLSTSPAEVPVQTQRIYSLEGTGSGDVGGVSFANKAFTISFFSDTSAVIEYEHTDSPSNYSIEDDTYSTIDIAGFELGTFTANKRIFLVHFSDHQPVLGLGGNTGDLLDVSHLSLDAYDLRDSFGPLLVNPHYLRFIDQATTIGDVTLTSAYNIIFSASIAPEHAVTNLVVQQRPGTKLVDITYDFFDSATNAVSIELEISDGTNTVLSTSASGDMGTGVTPGIGKLITWDAGADWNGNLGSLTFRVYQLQDSEISDSVTCPVDSRYVLSYSAGSNGAISGALAQQVVAGGNGTLVTAVPDSGYEFVEWGDGVQTAARQDINVSGDLTVSAVFSKIPVGVLQFSESVYDVSEDAGFVVVTVERVGGSYGDVVVEYSATNGTALAGTDYTLQPGVLAWSDGQSGSKSIFALITDNGTYDGNKAFSVSLENPTGTTVGSPDTTVVTIVDDEVPSSRISRIEGDLDFGDVPVNLPSSRTIEIWNDGSLPLSVTNVLAPTNFIVTPQTFAVSAGEAVTLSVRFDPDEMILYSGTLHLVSDATGGVTNLSLSGTGTTPVEIAGIRGIQGSTAIINVVVPPGSTVLGVEDELAPGVSAYSISDGGTWDAVNNKVKWFFSAPGQVRDRALQYTVNTNGYVIAGTVNFGESNLMITGDDQFAGGDDPGLLHPSDDNGDWRIELSEISGGVSRWRTGADNVKHSIITRGVTVYLAGETYRYDSAVGSEAKRWVPLAAPALSSPLALGEPLSEPVEGAVRSVQGTNVVISIVPEVGTTAWGFEESVPEGLSVSSISDGGTWDAVHRKIKWVFYDGLERSLTYCISGQPGMCGSLAGAVSFDGSEDQTTGDASVIFSLSFGTWLEQQSIPGDAETLFGAMNPEYGLPHGMIYALTTDLQPGDKEILVRIVNGKPCVEIPIRNATTLSSVDVLVEGTEDLSGGTWNLSPVPAEDQTGVLTGKQRWDLNGAPDKAFYRLKVIEK